MPSVFGPRREPGPKWDPKFPEFSRNPNQGSDREGELTPLQTGESDGTLPWTPAPSDSHLEGFRLYDAEDETVGRFIRRFLGGESSIQIRFRPSGKRGTTEYHYFFSDAKQARQVFEQLVNSANPGEIVHSVLIAQGIRYKRVT